MTTTAVATTAVATTTYFVSRHPGAVEWAKRHGFGEAIAVGHFDPTVIRSGDKVIGTLPINLAAEVCRRGGSYFHLSLTVPAEWRGRELSADDMESIGAQIGEFLIGTPQWFYEGGFCC